MPDKTDGVNYVAWFWGLFWLCFVGYFLYTSDYVQSRINHEVWAVDKEQRHIKFAERKAAIDASKRATKARSDRRKELDQIECHYLLKAERELFPIEIERNTLSGMTEEKAGQLVLRNYEIDVEFCEEFGLSPYSKPEVED